MNIDERLNSILIEFCPGPYDKDAAIKEINALFNQERVSAAKLLDDAAIDLQNWGDYVSEYF